MTKQIRLDTPLTAQEFMTWFGSHTDTEAHYTQGQHDLPTLKTYLADLRTRIERLCDPHDDLFVDYTMSDDGTLYEKCLNCHLFIEYNSEHGGINYDRDDIAEYVHLHRGTPEDEAIDYTHEAKSSGMKATLATWRQFGPPEMVARFTN